MNDDAQRELDNDMSTVDYTLMVWGGDAPEWTGVHPKLSDRQRSRVRQRFEDQRAADPVARDIAVTLAGRARQQEYAVRLKLAGAFGDDDFADGAVLRFRRQWSPGTTREYTYAAVKAAGRWYTTDGSARAWHELVAWMVSGESPVDPATVELMGPVRMITEPSGS